MKMQFNISFNALLTLSGILCGAFAAIAVTPLVTTPPTTNDTVVNFDTFMIGYYMGEVDGRYQTQANGQTFLTHFLPGLFTTDENGYLLPLRFGTEIDSDNAGLYSLGYYTGLVGQTVQSGGLFGRVGVEGRVNGPSAMARGFAGYLEYNSSLNPTVENSIDIAGLPTSSPSGAILDDYIRLSKGTPWAFYTEDKSKFKDEVLITGQLAAGSEPLVFADQVSPVNNPVVEISPFNSVQGDLEANSLTVEDFVASDDLSGKFFMVGAYEDFQPGHSDYEVFSVTAYCSDTNASAVRLGCSGGLVDTEPAPNNTPYLGTRQYSNTGCRSYARKPVGIVNGHLSTYAYCWIPN